ncbi:FabD/lysophospholipase-like protein [Pseudovirgaria hyperparasitica]|uniref:FabD/lysophospholipase-like protein n=1 Tax=Pseudovirgaria hyperparasitica TaxID=470096 RepID=A0A6A6WEA6_9PEZI|nr:FabD/lysophospholipase-like protein [Pseudovirgaria hyperparasitica]KAF2759917.1 FabD/lysophospholipase-like protein [Pseudovirgaria hyperparasitica]
MSLQASLSQGLSPNLSSSRPLSVITNNSENEDVTSGRAWSRRVVDAWDPLILTLDGGGIRGYSTLLILLQLMREISTWERKLEREEGPIPGATSRSYAVNELLPCHYFDYMYGTSTGGLIATMLGRLRMSVPQCLKIYREVGNDLFGHRRTRVPLATKYFHRPLETAVQRIVKTYCKTHPRGQCDGQDWHPWNLETKGRNPDDPWVPDISEERICQSICLTATHSGKIDEAYLLRSYNHRYNTRVQFADWLIKYNEGADPLRIWQVTRATSAAPFYFKALEADIRGEVKSFKDGGIRENNPASAAWSEFLSMYGEDQEPSLLLSVGTGKPNEAHDGFASAWPGPLGQLKVMKTASEKFAVVKNLMVKYTEGEQTHRTMLSTARGQHKWYKRLNVSSGLETMKLDNWEKGPWIDPETNMEIIVPGGASLRRMEEVTEKYLNRDFDHDHDTYAPPRTMLIQTAEKLVRHRRERERTKDQDLRRWQTFMGQWLTGELGPEDTVLPPLPDAQPPRRRRRS